MNAVVDISTTSQPDDQTLEELRTDESGNTEEVELSTPPLRVQYGTRCQSAVF